MIKKNVEYETKIQDNPFNILKYINILMHKPEQSKYLFASITEAFKQVVKMKQKYNESLIDYSKCLKQAKYNLEARVDKYIMVPQID